MKLSQLNKDYLLEMVQSMYRYEAKLHHMPRLLTTPEEFDFYCTYLGYQTWTHT